MRFIRYLLAGIASLVSAAALYSYMSIYLLLLAESLNFPSRSTPVDPATALPWLVVAILAGLLAFALIRSAHKSTQTAAQTEPAPAYATQTPGLA